MKRLSVLAFIVLTALPAYAGHEEQAAGSPWGMEWFCTPQVAAYMHPFLPTQATLLDRWTSDDKDYLRVWVYGKTPGTPVAEAVNEIIGGLLGPVVFFKTLPDGRVLCNKLQRKDA